MKYAAYTEETIWGIGDSAEEAREEGRAAMTDNDVPETDFAKLLIAPIDEDLVEALEEAEDTGAEVMFDLIDGALVEVEAVDEMEA